MITFKPENHTYWDEDGVQYTSVTTLLGKEFPFDQEAVAEKVANIPSSRYHGMSKERILKMWSDSSDHGNVVHEMVEDYIKEDVVPSDQSLVPLLDQFKRLNFRGELLSEVLVWDEDYLLAGTADILEVLPDKIYVHDIKTSRKVDETKLGKFSLQLEIYRRMIEKRFQKKTLRGFVLHFDDYVIQRSKTKLKLLTPLHLDDVVDDILRKRKEEIDGN